MGLFITCHFLFEIQLLCLSLHNEVLSFEDSEWSRGARKWSATWRNWNISDIFFSCSGSTIPFFSLCWHKYTNYRHQLRYIIGMDDVVHEPIDNEQSEMHIWPLSDVCEIGSEHAVPIHPIFEPCPLKANVARCSNDQFFTIASSRVH